MPPLERRTTLEEAMYRRFVRDGDVIYYSDILEDTHLDIAKRYDLGSVGHHPFRDKETRIVSDAGVIYPKEGKFSFEGNTGSVFINGIELLARVKTRSVAINILGKDNVA